MKEKITNKISGGWKLLPNGLDKAQKLYCLLNALLLIPKRRIPTPSRSRVTGQGKGQPKSGFGIRAMISTESTISHTPARMRIHFDAASIFYPLLF